MACTHPAYAKSGGDCPACLAEFRRKQSAYKPGQSTIAEEPVFPIPLGSTWTAIAEPSLTDATRKQERQFEILDILGAGGMAVVYKARRLDAPRANWAAAQAGKQNPVIALKVLLPDQTNENSVQRFWREAIATITLDHPNIVRVLECGHDPLAWITMEHVEGDMLRNILIREKQLPSEFVVHVIVEVCNALQYAHERGIVHRDVKPENIMLTADDVVKLADFGLVRFDHGDHPAGLTRPGTFVGTPPYAAPEQVAGAKAADRRADIYSVGVLMVEMLTGTKPEGEVLLHLSKELAAIGALEPVILKATSRDPAERYHSAAALKVAVQKVGDKWVSFYEARKILGIEKDELAAMIAREEIQTRKHGRWTILWRNQVDALALRLKRGKVDLNPEKLQPQAVWGQWIALGALLPMALFFLATRKAVRDMHLTGLEAAELVFFALSALLVTGGFTLCWTSSQETKGDDTAWQSNQTAIRGMVIAAAAAIILIGLAWLRWK